MSAEDKKSFAEWCLVELMGHQRIVGYVTEQTIGGAAMLRVDVPDAAGVTRFTRFYGGGAIYAINPVAREVALRLAAGVDAEPVKAWQLPAPAEERSAIRAETGAGYPPEPGADEPYLSGEEGGL